MHYYRRLISDNIIKDFYKGKVIILVGPRQSGKTTLLDQMTSQFPDSNILKINADNPTDRLLLQQKDFNQLDAIVAGAKIVIIDEAQRVPDIGITIKIMVDQYKETKQIIATGSSSINLLDATAEPLTGRKFTYQLYPISYEELIIDKGALTVAKELDSCLKYGTYPEILTTNYAKEKIRRLQELTSSYLFKDILEFQQVRNAQVLYNLLKALALQIGSQVSYSGLANLVGIDSKTVERYIDLLEKSFVLFRLPAYGKNKRREIARNKKIFFYDLGIRNAVIDNFNTFDKRNDLGQLWENFVITERMKFRSYHRIYGSQYFWRTYDGSEVDLVEEREGKLFGFEIKYQSSKAKQPKKWAEYESGRFQLINKENVEGFLY